MKETEGFSIRLFAEKCKGNGKLARGVKNSAGCRYSDKAEMLSDARTEKRKHGKRQKRPRSRKQKRHRI